MHTRITGWLRQYDGAVVEMVRPGQESDLPSASVVRETNVARIVELLRDHGSMSRAELVRASGLTRPTVMAIVSALTGSGIVTESGTRPARDVSTQRGGRPGSQLAFNGSVRTVVAAKVITGSLSLWQATANGVVIAERSVQTSWDPRRVLDLLVGEIQSLSGTSSSLGSVGVQLPGFIDQDSGTVTLARRGWDRVPVRATLERELGVGVSLLGPAEAAVVGEVSTGSARHHGNVVLIFLASGIGAGIIVNGRLVRGAGGVTGELGHCPVGSGRLCTCGKYGCLETVAAGWAIRSAAADALGLSGPAQANLVELAAFDDPRVNQVLAEAATALGAAGAWLVNLLNPSVLVLGSSHFTQGAQFFFDTFKAAALEHVVGDGDRVEIVQGTRWAGRHGAVQAALERLPAPIRPSLSVVA